MPDLGPFVVTGFAVGSVYALSGAGLVVLYRTTGVVNLAFGSLGALAAFAAWDLGERGVPQPVCWLLALAVVVLLSTVFGLVLGARLAARPPVVQLIATLGLALSITGFVSWHWGVQARALALPGEYSGFTILGVRVGAITVAAVVLALVVAVGVTVVLNATLTGTRMRAMAQDRATSAVLGVPVRRLGAMAWAGTGLLAGASGILIANLVRLDVNTLTLIVVPGLAAAILGRLRSLPVAVAGGFAIGVVESCLTAFDTVGLYSQVTPFVLAVAMLVLVHGQGVIAVSAGAGR